MRAVTTPFGIEPGWHVDQIDEGAEEQQRSDQQHGAHGGLCADQHLPHPLASPAGCATAALLLQGVPQIHAQNLEQRRDGDGEPHQCAKPERRGDNGGVDRKSGELPVESRGDAEQTAHQERCGEKAHDSGDRGEDELFDHQSSCYASRRCTKRRPHGDFASASRGTKEQQAGGVRGCDEQDERDRAHQAEEGGPERSELPFVARRCRICPRPPVAGESRVTRRLRQSSQFGVERSEGRGVRQPADHFEVLTAATTIRAEGSIDIGVGWSRMSLPEDADDGVCASAEIHGAPYDGCRVEALTSHEVFVENDDRWWCISILVGREGAPPGWCDAQRLEVAARHQPILLVADTALEGHVQAGAANGRRDRPARADVVAEESHVAVRGVAELGAEDSANGHEPIRVWIRERPEQHCVDQREHRQRRTQSETERWHCRHGEAGLSPQLTKRKGKILHGLALLTSARMQTLAYWR